MIICLVRLINISNILIMFLISKKYPPPLVHLLFCYLSGQPLKIVWKITLIPPNAHRWRAQLVTGVGSPICDFRIQSMLFVVHVADFATATCWICDETQ